MHSKRTRRFILILSLLVALPGCSGDDQPERPSSRDRPSEPNIGGTPNAPAQNNGGTSSAVVDGSTGDGWGDLKLTFTYDGEWLAPTPVSVTVDTEYCGRETILNKSLIVNPDNKGIANVVVMLNPKSGELPPIHESYAAQSEEPLVLTNDKCMFVPHIGVLRTGQTLLLKNADEVGHNVKCDPVNNLPINPILAPQVELPVTSFVDAETRPISVSCSVHPWMKSYLIVKDHPYVGVSDENGQVVIENLPEGNYQFIIWHERGGYISEASQDGTEYKWARGKATFTIAPDADNDQGAFAVPADSFAD